VTPGGFAQLDLTYLALTHFWTRPPDDAFPCRIHLGARLGVDFSESYPSARTPLAPPYLLIRPGVGWFVDVEHPLSADRVYALVIRAAADTSVTLSSPFRYGLAVGISYGWDNG
jgi:hypothetical protein